MTLTVTYNDGSSEKLQRVKGFSAELDRLITLKIRPLKSWPWWGIARTSTPILKKHIIRIDVTD